MTQRLDYNQIAPNGIKALGSVYGYVLQSACRVNWWISSICGSRRSTTAPIVSTCTPATSSNEG